MKLAGKCAKCGNTNLDGVRRDGRAFWLPKQRAHELDVIEVTCPKCNNTWSIQTPLGIDSY
jgi:predicted nucleic-acid-binding Zn-ribbon protein